MSSVLSIRIDKKLREAMRKIPIDWRSEIENFIRMRIRDYLKKQYLEEAKNLRKKLPKIEISHASLIREDRDAH